MKKQNLTEEIYRMRKLMNFDSKEFNENTTSLDRLVESKIVSKMLNEQNDTIEECETITHTGSFGVEETTGSGAFTEFINKIKETIDSNPKLKEKSEKGVVYVTEFNLIGGASNYHTGSSVEPDLNNDGVTPYNGTNTYKKDKNSTNYTKNKQLAVDRAKNLAKKLGEKGGLDTINVVYDKGTLENALKNTKGYVIDTGGTNDKNKKQWKGSDGKTYKPGQIVKIEMTICYKSKEQEEDEPEEEVITGTTEIVITGRTFDIIQECFNNSVIEVNYTDLSKSHNCNHAIYEIYANGLKLKRRTKGELYDYASLNNVSPLDNAEKDGKKRYNKFYLTIDGENGKFFNEDVIGKHNGKLVIEAACKRTKKPNGRFLGPWKNYSDCHEGVGDIVLNIKSLNSREEQVVETPNEFDTVVKLAEFPACENLVKKISEGEPKILQKIKIWWQKLRKKRMDKQKENQSGARTSQDQ